MMSDAVPSAILYDYPGGSALRIFQLNQGSFFTSHDRSGRMVLQFLTDNGHTGDHETLRTVVVVPMIGTLPLSPTRPDAGDS